jgi:puromycin-sensitive aminopeptidase
VITYWKGAGVVRMIERFLGSDAFQAGVRSYLQRYAERNATADDFWRELDQASGRDVTAIANAWIREPGHPVVEIASRFDATGATLTLRQRRFFSDPQMTGAAAEQRWPVPLVLKVGSPSGIREERVILAGESAEVTFSGATWVFPNGGGAGFYRFSLDDGAIDRLAGSLATGLAPEERLNLVGNQWALLKAGIGNVGAFLTLIRGFAGEQDRAVLEAIAQRLGWLECHVLADADRPRFAALVQALYGPELAALGWDARDGEPVDLRVKRSAVVHALGHLGRDGAVLDEARARLERYLVDRGTLEPNLVPVVANLVARNADTALYERFLERKRASAADDPEEEERFLYALASFETPALVERTLALTFTDDVRMQDRAFVLSRLLGSRAARDATWAFVRDGWSERILTMDPMLRQYVIRGMAALTSPALAGPVGEFLAAHVTDDTRETTAQAREQLRIDAAAVTRLGPELTAALRTGSGTVG